MGWVFLQQITLAKSKICHEKGTADCGKVSYTLSVIYPDELCEVKQNYGKYKLNEVNKWIRLGQP